MIVYSGNNSTPSYLSECTADYKEIKANEISKTFINTDLQSSDIFVIDDLLSLPYEWLKLDYIQPIIILNIDESKLPDTIKIYQEFINKFITPFDIIISNDLLNRSFPSLHNIIKSSSSQIIEKSHLNIQLKKIRNNSCTNSKPKPYEQFSEAYNKIAYLHHEQLFLRLIKDILNDFGPNMGSVIEISNRNEILYKKHLKLLNWSYCHYPIINKSIPALPSNSLDTKHNIAIVAFQYHKIDLSLYKSVLEKITTQILSGGYIIIFEDLIPPDVMKKGLPINDFEQLLVESSNSQFSLCHFELFQYKGICNEVSSACYVLRKLGHSE